MRLLKDNTPTHAGSLCGTAWRGCWLGALLILLAADVAAGAVPKRVLLLHSYGQSFAPFNSFAEGFRIELGQHLAQPVEFYDVALESARFEGGSSEGPLADYLAALFAARQPDLVVTIGGPAARFAQQQRHQLFRGTPTLIACTDQRHLQNAALTTNDAVVAVALDPALVLSNILQVLPETTNIVVVIGASPVEKFWLAEMRRQFQPFVKRLNFIWLNELSFSDMQKRSAILPPRSAVFYAMLSVDADGVPYTEERALAGLRAVANAPIFGLYDTQLGRGIVGGPLMAIEDLSRNTAKVAVRILQGEPAGTIKTPVQTPGRSLYDWRELQRWGISESRLPPNSMVRFRQPTVWELYKKRVMAVVSLCLLEALLIVLLIANLVKRRRAERSLRESEERLTLAMAAADVGVWVWDIPRNEVWASANWRRMFGFPLDAAIRFENVMLKVHADDRVGLERAVRRAVDDRASYMSEYRVVMPDGTHRWIAARGRLESVNGAKPARLLGVSIDVTERKRVEKAVHDLSGRLIGAQEEERARLARELHDDVTQRLARMAIDAGRAERGSADPALAGTMREVREGLVRLSEDIHTLSYRLHPAVLEDLGLAEALNAEVGRFTRHESVPVEAKFSDIPDEVPANAALCLFRIAQEALRNAGRHAQARKVEVLVRRLDNGLQLAVRDDGRGFDVTRHPDRPSLGLASMRERVNLLGGELDIESAPGQGTTILAWVPLKKALP